jgi:2,4-dienoyl-CoA reductase-like NADH-dependent reductase (Old Yellow Enzyme family)
MNIDKNAGTILFEPLAIGKMVIPGRIIKTATAETMATPEGYVTDELLRFYEMYAKAGTPMIITGNLYPQATGKVYTRMTGADADDKIEGLKQLTRIVHQHGSMICAQLSHGGRQVFQRSANNDPVSASNVLDKLTWVKPRTMTVAEVKEFVANFANAAERCQRAGFDAVQIHAAHGYLISQFLTPYTNRRIDDYGGSFKNRLKLLLDVYHATRDRVGSEFPILLKINGSDSLPFRRGLSTTELVEIARVMQEEGLDGVEISVGHYESGFPTIHGTLDRKSVV